MLLDLLLPQRCVVCRRGGAQLCEGCAAAFPRLRPPWCARCGSPTAWPVERCRLCAGRRIAYATARSAVVYDDAVRAAVAAWKDRGLRRFAEVAAAIAAETLPALPHPIVPVAPDPDRRLRRGHHPAGALAAALAARWNVPLLDLLARVPGRPQRGLGLSDRRANVRGAFRSRPASPRVTLVDDVFTSGATATAAASALRRAGAREVHVVTFARAVRGYYSADESSIAAQGGRIATSGEGQERGRQREDPRLRGAEARQARPPAR